MEEDDEDVPKFIKKYTNPSSYEIKNNYFTSKQGDVYFQKN
jgi:hypothetical protein